jgi:hypothetical protein
MATLVLTWQEVSNWLDLPQEHADEMFLMRRAEAIESHVNKFLAGYRIGQVSRTDQTVDGTGTKTLASPEAPLTALTAIKLGPSLRLRAASRGQTAARSRVKNSAST